MDNQMCVLVQECIHWICDQGNYSALRARSEAQDLVHPEAPSLQGRREHDGVIRGEADGPVGDSQRLVHVAPVEKRAGERCPRVCQVRRRGPEPDRDVEQGRLRPWAPCPGGSPHSAGGGAPGRP